jgi:hypothetical protein
MRPRDNAAAAREPAATPTAKKRLMAISTSMSPPMRDLMMTGTSEGHRADRPEPAHANRADPLTVVGGKLADHG